MRLTKLGWAWYSYIILTIIFGIMGFVNVWKIPSWQSYWFFGSIMPNIIINSMLLNIDKLIIIEDSTTEKECNEL